MVGMQRLGKSVWRRFGRKGERRYLTVSGQKSSYAAWGGGLSSVTVLPMMHHKPTCPTSRAPLHVKQRGFFFALAWYGGCLFVCGLSSSEGAAEIWLYDSDQRDRISQPAIGPSESHVRKTRFIQRSVICASSAQGIICMASLSAGIFFSLQTDSKWRSRSGRITDSLPSREEEKLPKNFTSFVLYCKIPEKNR